MTLAQFNELFGQYTQGEERKDYRAALICSVLANVYRDPKKRPKPFTPSDFMPRRINRQMATGNHVKDSLNLITKALGGEIVE